MEYTIANVGRCEQRPEEEVGSELGVNQWELSAERRSRAASVWLTTGVCKSSSIGSQCSTERRRGRFGDVTYFLSSLPPFAFLFQNPEASSSTVFPPFHPFADSRLNSSLWISDNFSPALLTTLKNRHLKAFCGSPAMLWLPCCVNRGSLPRGHVPRCWGPGGPEACAEVCTVGCAHGQLGVRPLGSVPCRVPAFRKGQGTRLLAHQQREAWTRKGGSPM